jgi:predicted dehydrogenase
MHPGESPTGGMTGKGLHVTDLMIALFGPVTEVDARSLRRVPEADLDDTTVMLLRFALGMSGYLATLTATADIWRMQVFGSQGWAEMRGVGELVTKTLQDPPRTQRFDAVDIERAELEAFADAVECGRPFPVRRDEAVNNIALLEAIGRSAGDGRAVAVEPADLPAVHQTEHRRQP